MMPCFVTMGFSRRFFLCGMNKDLVAREAVHALVQWPSLRNLSDQLNRRRVETCLLLFFGQVLGRVLTAARCELLASLPPLLCQPGNDQRKPWGTPYLRIVGCFRVVNCLRDVFLRIWDNPFGWRFLSINPAHATCFVKHLGGFFWRGGAGTAGVATMPAEADLVVFVLL